MTINIKDLRLRYNGLTSSQIAEKIVEDHPFHHNTWHEILDIVAQLPIKRPHLLRIYKYYAEKMAFRSTSTYEKMIKAVGINAFLEMVNEIHFDSEQEDQLFIYNVGYALKRCAVSERDQEEIRAFRAR